MTKQKVKTILNESKIVPQTEYIQLSKLVISDANVRKVNANNKADKQLIASIKKNGVIQNLVTFKVNNKYHVVAGGRRLSALQHLLKSKEIKNSYPVNCYVAKDVNDATRLSLVENINRSEMEVIDQLNAFQKLVSEGSSIADISVSFGYSKVHVKRILALSTVHPKILKAFSEGKFKMDVLEAFTVTSDKEKQLECFDACNYFCSSDIRREINNSGYSSKSKIARFVGKANYLNNDGVIMPDLFKNKETFIDGDLLKNLSFDKLTQLVNADVESQKFKWIHIDREGDFDLDDNLYEELKGEYVNVPDDLMSSLEDAKKCRSSASWGSDERNNAITEIEVLEAKIRDYLRFSEDQMKFSGVVASFDCMGNVCFYRGLMNEDDSLAFDKSKASSEIENKSEMIKEIQPDVVGLSQALKDNLSIHDCQLTQLNLLKNPALAVEAFMFDTVFDLLSGDDTYHYGKIFDTETNNKVNHSDSLVVTTRAYDEIKTIKDSINKSWLVKQEKSEKYDVQKSYVSFCSLDLLEQHFIFGQVVAFSATATKDRSGSSSIYENVINKSDFNKVEYFTPTKANYFGRLKLEPLQELCIKLFGNEWMTEKKSLPRGKLAECAEIDYLALDDQTFLPEMM